MMDTAGVITEMNILKTILMNTVTAIVDIDSRRISMVGNNIAGTGGARLRATALATTVTIGIKITVDRHLRQSQR